MKHQTRLTTSEPDQPSETLAQWIVDGSITPTYPPPLPSTAAHAHDQRSPPVRTIIIATAACFASLLMTLGISFWTQGLSIIWLGNSVGVGILLLVPRRHWRYYGAISLVATIIALLIVAYPLTIAIGTSIIHLLESLLIAHMLAADPDWLAGRTDRFATWLRFGWWGVLVAPTLASAAGALMIVAATGGLFWPVFGEWYISDALAVCILLPMILRLRPFQLANLQREGRLLEMALIIIIFGGLAASIFEQATILALFIVIPLLTIILFRVGFAGVIACIGVLAVAALGSTLAQHGPIFAIAQGSTPDAVLITQIFLMITFATVVVIGALLTERQHLQSMLDLNDKLYRMVATDMVDLTFVTDMFGTYRYVAPMSSEFLGIPDQKVLNGNWRDLLPVEDLSVWEDMYANLRKHHAHAEFTYRMRHVDGSYRWFEGRCRVARHGKNEHIVIIAAQDITRRKLHQEALERANAHLEAEVASDALTGIANRRRFNEVLYQEWHRALRLGEPLSLLIIDVDYFKLYNDTYGHDQGDRCLKSVADLTVAALMRTTDFCARYGGEEFVVLLLDTHAQGAQHIGERICTAVRSAAIPHQQHPLGVVTISIGVSTLYPSGEEDGTLFRLADAALYYAKSHGRDQVSMQPTELQQQQVN